MWRTTRATAVIAAATNATPVSAATRDHIGLRDRDEPAGVPAGSCETCAFVQHEQRCRDVGHTMPAILEQTTLKKSAELRGGVSEASADQSGSSLQDVRERVA